MRRHRGLLKTRVWALVEDGAWGKEGKTREGHAVGQGKMRRRREDGWRWKAGGRKGRGYDRGMQGL